MLSETLLECARNYLWVSVSDMAFAVQKVTVGKMVIKAATGQSAGNRVASQDAFSAFEFGIDVRNLQMLQCLAEGEAKDNGSVFALKNFEKFL